VLQEAIALLQLTAAQRPSRPTALAPHGQAQVPQAPCPALILALLPLLLRFLLLLLLLRLHLHLPPHQHCVEDGPNWGGPLDQPHLLSHTLQQAASERAAPGCL